MGRVASALGLSWTEAGLVVLTATGIYLAVVVLSRVFGQRQFAQSSTYDLAFVFALGSLIGRVILVRTSLLAAVVGLVTMFLLHSATGWLHHHNATVHRLMQNRPVLLVAHGASSTTCCRPRGPAGSSSTGTCGSRGSRRPTASQR